MVERRKKMKVINQEIHKKWALYHGDCCEVIKGLPDNSIGYSIFSPPFSSLYVYSNYNEDMGNSKDDEEFYKQFSFLTPELYRVIAPGRNVSFHCMDLPTTKERDGYIGTRDFPGELIRKFQDAGFIYHSRVTIWKDPLIAATRTKAIGLMHKQIVKDSALCRNGYADYLITMRKPGENKEPITHKEGLTEYYGSGKIPFKPGGLKEPSYSHHVWRKYASPVWEDIRQTYTLNAVTARDDKDERHICPLQLDVIARGLVLWSNPNDIVLSPFAGIGSEGYQAVKMGRRFVGIELKDSYYAQAIKNLINAENMAHETTLMDFANEPESI
jgi:DNA modification methylase